MICAKLLWKVGLPRPLLLHPHQLPGLWLPLPQFRIIPISTSRSQELEEVWYLPSILMHTPLVPVLPWPILFLLAPRIPSQILMRTALCPIRVEVPPLRSRSLDPCLPPLPSPHLSLESLCLRNRRPRRDQRWIRTQVLQTQSRTKVGGVTKIVRRLEKRGWPEHKQR